MKFNIVLFCLFTMGFVNISLSQSLSSVIHLPNSQTSEVRAVRMDDNHNVYVAGSFDGTLQLGNSNMTAVGQKDGFLAKFDSQGTCVWSQNIGTSNTDKLNDLVLDENGNVYVCGYFNANSPNDNDKYLPVLSSTGDTSKVIKFDSNGNQIWSISFTGGNSNTVSLSYKNNEIVVVGYFSGSVNFGATPSGNPVSSAINGFIGKISSSGNISWIKLIGSTGSTCYATDVVIDSNNNIYINGSYSGTGYFNPNSTSFTLGTVGGVDVFHMCLNSSGNFIWANSIGSSTSSTGGAANDRSRGMAVDNQNNIISVGRMAGDMDVNPNSGTYNLLSSDGTGYLLKMNSSGNFIWGRNLRSENYDVTTDALGNIYYTGTIGAGQTDFDLSGGTNILSSLTVNSFLSKINSAGNFLYAYLTSSTNQSDQLRATCISFENNGELCHAGDFIGTAVIDNFVNSPLFSDSGSKDGIVYKFLSGFVTTNMNTFLDENLLWLFPNPNSGNFYISISDLGFSDKVQVIVENPLGQRVFNSIVTENLNVVNSWGGKGLHIVRLIDSNNNMVCRKVLLQ